MAEDTKTEMVRCNYPDCGCDWDAICSTEVQHRETVARCKAIKRGIELERRDLAACPSADKAEGVGEPVAWASERCLDRIKSDGEPLINCILATDQHGSYDTPLYAPGTDPAIARLTEANAELRKLHDGLNATLKACFGEDVGALLAKLLAAETALAQRDADIAKAVEETLERAAKIADAEADVCEGQIKAYREIKDYRSASANSERADSCRRIAAALRASSATQADGGGK